MNNPSIVHSLVDKKASFKYNENENTDESILEYIKANCEYPDQNECKGIVYVRFEVDKYGSVIDFTKLKDHGECNEFFQRSIIGSYVDAEMATCRD